MIIFAHRGASGHAPENTIAAMQKAIDLGATAIELDIHEVEGELYVFHDRRLDGKSSGTGLINQCSKAYIESIHVSGEPIPTLWQVMVFLKDHQCQVNIELKGETCLAPFIHLYPKLLSELNFQPQDVLVSSFNHLFLLAFSKQFPNAHIAPLLEGIPLDLALVASSLNAYSLHLSLNFLSEKIIEDAHNRGVKVFVYTVDNPEDMLMLQQLKVDGIFTNFPDVAHATLDDK